MAQEAEPRPAAEERLRAVGDRCICLHTRMAARAVTRAYDAALAPLGLEGTQFTLLSAIAVDPTRSVTAMADRLALERSSLSRNLSLLRARGLIAPMDGRGRAVRYAVTEAGLALIEAALPAWDAVQRRLEKEIGENGWAELRGGLRRIRRAAAPD
jgi:DNA-binding MarR family transcriptional regulator